LELENNTTSQSLLQANESLNAPVEPAGSSGALSSGAGFGLTNFNTPKTTPSNEKPPKKPFLSRRVMVIIILILLALLALSAIIFGLWRLNWLRGQASEKTKTTDKYSQQSITIDGQTSSTTVSTSLLSASQQVDVNGSLQVAGSLRLIPTTRPTSPIAGQQYVDASDNKLYLYNGSEWIAQLNVIDLNSVNASIQNLQVQNASITNLANAASATANSAANAALPSNVTLQGNTFNGASQLVQLNGSGSLPALNGSLLTNVDAVSLQGNGASYFTNASNISSGTLSDSRLSGNVALLNANNTFSGNNSLTGTFLQQNAVDSTASFQIQNAAGTSNLFVADTTNTRVGIGKSAPSYTLDVNGDTNLAATGKLYIGGVAICDISGCGSAPGGSGYIQNVGTSPTQQTGNFNIKPTNAGVVGGIIQANASQTADLFETRDSSGTALVVAGATNNLALSVNGDLTIKAKPDAADNDFAQHTATAQLGKPSIKTGTYVGNYAGSYSSGTCDGDSGLGTQTVSLGSGWGKANFMIVQATTSPGLPLTPIAIVDGYKPGFKIDGVLTNSSRGFGAYGDHNLDMIRDISVADQMTVGCLYNKVGITYSYVAVRTESGAADDYFAYGTYTGDGTSSQNISLPGGKTWTPDMTLLFEEAAVPSDPTRLPYWRSSDMPSGQSLRFGDGAFVSDQINGFGPGYFTVGSSGNTNQAGAIYHYVTFRKLSNEIDTTTYTGDGTSGRSVPISSNFQPDFSWIKADAYTGLNSFHADFRSSGFATNMSQTTHGSFSSGLIDNFYSNGFIIGNSSPGNWVNDNGKTFYSFNLKAQTWLSNVNGYGPGAVYNGRLYTSTSITDFGQVFAYTSGDNFTEISSSAGKIRSDDPGNIDGLGDLRVYDNKLFAATLTGSGGNSAGLYSYDGSSWTRLNSTLGSFGASSNIDDVTSTAVVNGQLYIATGEADGAEIYRYNGGTSFTKISDSTAGKIVSGDTANIDAVKLVNFAGNLYAASTTGSGTAAVYVYDGASWTKLNGTSGTFGATSAIDQVDAMTVYNGALVVSTSKTAGSNAEIYRLAASQGGVSGATFVKMSYGTGQIMSGGSNTVTKVATLKVYGGNLLAGVFDAGKGAVYRYNNSDASLVNSWGLLCTSGSCPVGTMGGDSGIAGVMSITEYNGDLYVGSSKSADSHLYSFHRNDLTSYGLKFVGSSSGGFDNIGTFSFQSGSDGTGTSANTGQFLLSHTLTTSAGAYDIAEDYQTSDDELSAGDVVAIDPSRNAGFVRRANLAGGDAQRLLGIVSTHPAFRLSQKENYDSVAGSRTLPIALAGRVPVKIDSDSDSITPGDYLGASQKVGLATKLSAPGGAIAKALEGWQKGSGQTTIEVFVSNTFLLPGGPTTISPTSSSDQMIASAKPITLFDAFLATTGDTLQALKDFTVFGKAIFKGRVEFNDRIIYKDIDMAGHATISKGQNQVQIRFDKPYGKTPIISVTPLNYIRFKIVDKTERGFTIQVDDEVQNKVEFDWTAVEVEGAKIFESPPPN